MGSDRARVTFDPTRMWRGVVAQQGRVSLEADWNESEAIGGAALRHLTLDVVGTVGSPDGGYAVTSVSGSSSGDAAGQDLAIGAGVLYLGGERLELPAAITYSDQPDWLDAATDPTYVPVGSIPTTTTEELVYLTATEVEVSAVEDPALADVAIGGPDTAQRLRILQRVRRSATGSATCTGAWAQLQSQWATEGYAFDPDTMVLGSTAQLAVSFSTEVGTPTPCQPVATGGYLGADNQMYRVEIVSVDASGNPTIVWGPDDASFLYRVTASQDSGGATTLTLASPPVDSYHYPQSGQAVQLLASAVVLAPTAGGDPASYVASPTGVVATVAQAYAPGSQLVVLNEPASGPVPTEYFDATATPQLFLRVWQGTGVATPGQPFALNDTANGVDTGVAVTLTSSSGFHVGDFWRFALRPIAPAQIYPARYMDGPQPPDGPVTWAGPLATVGWAGTTPTVGSCVATFENLVGLSEGGGCCTIDVGPADVADGAGLAALVSRYAGQAPVTVCLAPGTYTLPQPLVIGTGNDGLTIRACQGGVTLTGPPAPVPAGFQSGLVYVQGATGVSFEGIAFEAPAAAYAAPASAVSALATADDTLIEAFAGSVAVSAAVVASGATDLAFSDCTFTFPAASGNAFSVGVLATGQVDGCRITGCSFTDPSPPGGAPYNGIVLGYGSQPPYQATYGFLHVPSPAPAPAPAATAASTVTDPALAGELANVQTRSLAPEAADIARQGAVTGAAPEAAADIAPEAVADIAAAAPADTASATAAAPAAATGTTLAPDAERLTAATGEAEVNLGAAATGALGSLATGTAAAAGTAAASGTSAAGTTTAPTAPVTSLDDAVVESCLFEGLSVAALVIAHVGTARFDGNVVRNSYGGVWIFTSDATSLGAQLSQLAPSATQTTDVTTAYLDPLIKMAYAMGMLLALAPPAPAPAAPSGLSSTLVFREGDSLLDRQVTLPDDVLASDVPTGEVAEVSTGQVATVAGESSVGAGLASLAGDFGNIPGLGTTPSAPQPPATTAVGTDLVLRLDFSHNQIDAVLADTYSGAGLVVADQSSVAGSAVVCGNRIRTRFQEGEAVIVEQVAQAAVNDNLIANEAVPTAATTPPVYTNFVPPGQAGLCYSLVVGVPTILSGPAVAVTGNVLVGSVSLPARSGLGFPTDVQGDATSALAVLSSWAFLNTVIAPYAAPATASGI